MYFGIPDAQDVSSAEFPSDAIFRRGRQSTLTTSPPLRVTSIAIVLSGVESRRNRTLPSHIAVFTPPSWKLYIRKPHSFDELIFMGTVAGMVPDGQATRWPISYGLSLVAHAPPRARATFGSVVSVWAGVMVLPRQTSSRPAHSESRIVLLVPSPIAAMRVGPSENGRSAPFRSAPAVNWSATARSALIAMFTPSVTK